MNNINENKTIVFALGGLSEVGKNMYCVEHNNELVIIDAGIKFASSTQLGINGIIPELTYLKENQHKIKSLLITHGHEDHIGAIPFLLKEVKIPVIHAPLLAKKLIEKRLEEHKIKNANIVPFDNTTVVKTKEFEITFFRVNHSIPDAFGIAVGTPNGTVVSTGDYKFEFSKVAQPADFYQMSELGKKGVKLLLADSTNAEIDGFTIEEGDIAKNITKIIKKAKGRVILSTFASNIGRIGKVIESAIALNRKIFIFGRSMVKGVEVSRDIGYINAPKSAFLSEKRLSSTPDKEVLIFCTGSQGEEMAALNRMAHGAHTYVNPKPGDTIIFSSSAIPGNFFAVEQLVNKLYRTGATIIQNSPTNQIHASGHAAQGDHKIMFNLLKPEFFMPVHGTYSMQKRHGNTGVESGVKPENVFILANGDTLILEKDKAYPGHRVPADDIFIDGKDVTTANNTVIKDRTTLSREGVVSVVLSIDASKNLLLREPYITSRGSFVVKDSGGLIRECIKRVDQAIKEELKGKTNFTKLKQVVKSTVSPIIFRWKKRNPIIVPIILNRKQFDATKAEQEINKEQAV